MQKKNKTSDQSQKESDHEINFEVEEAIGESNAPITQYQSDQKVQRNPESVVI